MSVLDEKKADKGQLISECPFDVSNFPKIHQKKWQNSAQGSNVLFFDVTKTVLV